MLLAEPVGYQGTGGERASKKCLGSMIEPQQAEPADRGLSLYNVTHDPLALCRLRPHPVPAVLDGFARTKTRQEVRREVGSEEGRAQFSGGQGGQRQAGPERR